MAYLMDELAAFPNEIRANDAAQKLRNLAWVTSKVVVCGRCSFEGHRAIRSWVVALKVPENAGCHSPQFLERARRALFSCHTPEVLHA